MKRLIRPFDYLSGEVTLAWGGVGVLIMTFGAWYFGSTFRGVVSQGMGELSLWQLALQQLSGWLVFSTLLYTAARIVSKSKIRVVDIFGNQLFARLTLIPILFGASLPAVRAMTDQLRSVAPDQLAANSDIMTSGDMMLLTTFGLASLAVLVWFFVWSFIGFALSANLRGWRAAVPYIICYLMAEVVASFCTSNIAGW